MPGGDYGFARAPHGTYARDLRHFVDLFDYAPMESILAATSFGGELMGYPVDFGQDAARVLRRCYFGRRGSFERDGDFAGSKAIAYHCYQWPCS